MKLSTYRMSLDIDDMSARSLQTAPPECDYIHPL